jgi:hypothetical protein
MVSLHALGYAGGAQVVLISRDPVRMEEARATVERVGAQAHAARANITSARGPDEVVETALVRRGLPARAVHRHNGPEH